MKSIDKVSLTGDKEPDGSASFRAFPSHLPLTMNTPSEVEFLRGMDREKENVPQADPNLATPKAPTFRVPDRSGKFLGIPGASDFVPSDAGALKKMEAFGRTCVAYINNEPDFSPFSVHMSPWGELKTTVEIGHMTANRSNAALDEGRRPKGTRTDPLYEPGNYAQADLLFAERYHISADDIMRFRIQEKLTWHECADGGTMMLVPQVIHGNCPHTGGRATQKYLAEWGDVERDISDGRSRVSRKNRTKEASRRPIMGIRKISGHDLDKDTKTISHDELSRMQKLEKDEITSIAEECEGIMGTIDDLMKEKKVLENAELPEADKKEKLNILNNLLSEKKEQLKNERDMLVEAKEKMEELKDEAERRIDESNSTSEKMNTEDVKGLLSKDVLINQQTLNECNISLSSIENQNKMNDSYIDELSDLN